MKYTITRQNSVETSADLSAAFLSGTADADSLEIGAGAYLRSSGKDAAGVLLDNTLPWTVQVDGEIQSQRYDGMVLLGGTSGLSKINVGSEGEIVGGVNGIQASGTVAIKNNGTIQAFNGSAVFVSSEDGNKLVNKGLVSGEYSYRSYSPDSGDRVKNVGEMTGSISLNGGDDRLVNAGKIVGGLATGDLNLGDGDDTLINSGTISLEIMDGHGSETIQNRGLIDHNVFLGEDPDLFTNYVETKSGQVSGTVTGEIDLGAGDDRLEGGASIELYRDGSGADIANLRGGDDIYFGVGLVASDGEDHINGGKGIDTYDARSAVDPLFINLDRVSHALPQGSSMAEIAAQTAMGSDIAETVSDRIKSFENVLGGIESDVIFGSAKDNYLSGADGDDRLFGEGGNDNLVGGYGVDYLTGGAGKDMLTGGGDFDMFVFVTLEDSGVKASTRDVIVDFEVGKDNISFEGIDANSSTSINDIFEFLGMDTGFSGTAGELRAEKTANGVIIEGDVDGDAIGDFSVLVDKTVDFQASDFEL